MRFHALQEEVSMNMRLVDNNSDFIEIHLKQL